MVGKLLLILLISLVILDAWVQAKGKKSQKTKRNNTMILIPKTFRGQKIIPEIEWSTDSPSSSSSSPSPAPHLALHANSTAEYLTGVLSTRVIPAAYAAAILIGIPSNAAILGTLGAKTKTFSAAILYFSLALSDLLFLLTLIAKVLYHLNGNDWVFGEALCKVVTACFYGNVYCSIHTLTCLSVKRYLAIVHPFAYKGLPKRSCAIWSVLTVWAVFFAGTVPEFLVRQSYHLPQLGITTCHDVLPLNDRSYSFLPYYKLCLTCAGFFLPFLVTVISYMSIIHQLNKSHHDWAYYIKTSTLVFVVFAVCFAPSNVISFIHYINLYTSREEHFYIFYSVAVCLCSLHSCLDPFLLSLMSRSTGSKSNYLTFKGKTVSISV
ncbi:hypothetical protein MATL_G00088980 [Megalops atlanticus]|uniref:G-protein coupled receptors family 1 profile domain-containing protein n=1 Tax=Megalops atlanticus TaxID=7932 RepID=A0A9D3Q4B2_MEGAT|nr:hypothetical protein MATL_G00088980 [Megalops atlanticus]